MTTKAKDRFERQAGLVPHDKLLETNIMIVGVGAVGRSVALQLAAIGASNVMLVDFDIVEETNVTTQGYRYDQLQQKKVVATASDMIALDPSLSVATVDGRFSDVLLLNARTNKKPIHVMFTCVDSIEIRELLHESCKQFNVTMIDGRMLGETLRVLTSTPMDRTRYESTLFAAEEAEQGRCTARSTIYAANITASMMVHQLTRYLRDIPLSPDLLMTLLDDSLGEGPVENDNDDEDTDDDTEPALASSAH